MARQLKLGQFCGQAVRRRQAHGFLITENLFAPSLRIDRHVHDHPHFTFVIEGGFSESYDQIVLDCLAGSVLFVPANQPHTDHIAPAGAHTIGVELSPKLADRITEQTGLLNDPRVLTDAKVALAGRKLYEEFRSSDGASPLYMEALALEILVLASRAREVSKDGEPRWMNKVRELLHARFTHPLSLAELAEVAGVHETHLARAFRRRHGCTVGDYIRRLRVDAAALALRNGDRSVAEIAVDCGFFDQAHLCRCFKKAYGLSPSAYRIR